MFEIETYSGAPSCFYSEPSTYAGAVGCSFMNFHDAKLIR
jgi:hypothetical protein